MFLCLCDPLPSDMGPAGQTVFTGVLGSTSSGEGLHAAGRSTPSPTHPRHAGAKRREGQSWWQDQPRPS